MIIRTSLVALTLAAAASTANAVTVATFADPSPGPVPNLFSWNAATGTLSSGWAGLGLLLQTPGTAAPDFPDATYAMTPLVSVGSIANVFFFGPGSIQFFDNAAVPILNISFNSGQMLYAQGFGSSYFVGNGVVFSGPALGAFMSISNEEFSFSFANVVPGPQGSFTSTASFTSSAEIIIPGPASLAILSFGCLIAQRRRR